MSGRCSKALAILGCPVDSNVRSGDVAESSRQERHHDGRHLGRLRKSRQVVRARGCRDGSGAVRCFFVSVVRGEQYFRSEPFSARKITVWIFLCFWGTFAVIAVLALHGSAPPYFDLGAALLLLPLVALGVVRAALVSVTANEHELRITNQFRTYRFTWSEIERVEPSYRSVYLGSTVPALRFRRKSGRSVKAQAVSSKPWEQEATMKDLRRVAPTEIVIDTDIDKFRPRRTFRRG